MGDMIMEEIDMDRMVFEDALKSGSLRKMRQLPKCDLHNHAARGGKQTYVEKMLGMSFPPTQIVFRSLEEADAWLKKGLSQSRLSSKMTYLKCVEASFVFAKEDSIMYLALDFGLGEIFSFGGMETFVHIIDVIKNNFIPEVIFEPVLAIYDNEGIQYLDEIFSYGWFKALDIINYKRLLSMNDMKEICNYARKYHIRTKAHIGEVGSPDDIWRYAEELMLDEIQHGIQAIKSPAVMKWLAKNKIPLNICPASNIRLGLCKDYANHPIGQLYRNGIKVTVNTDDFLIFGASVSHEYLKLYQCNNMKIEELYNIYMLTQQRLLL